jgi:hypothetical protein
MIRSFSSAPFSSATFLATSDELHPMKALLQSHQQSPYAVYVITNKQFVIRVLLFFVSHRYDVDDINRS